MALAPRVVLVHRRTELEEVLDRHPTRGQAEFFLRTRGRDLDGVQAAHDEVVDARRVVGASVPHGFRRADVERSDLDRFLFEPDDVVVAVGQDGLVANVAKYLDGQSVVGIDPTTGRHPGVLVRHRPAEAGEVIVGAAEGWWPVERRTMVQVALDDGQALVALNEVFVGHPSHQSARYDLLVPRADGSVEQSSSGVIVGTGTGATGWCASLAGERARPPALPAPGAPSLAWFVREAWPSPRTDTSRTQGRLGHDDHLVVVARGDALVVFGDGMEGDHLVATWGQSVTVGVAPTRLALA